MKGREENDKSKLSICLIEPVVYLKDVDFSGRHRTHNELSPPSMVRGVLDLHLSKPTKICSIGIELTATSSTSCPEEIGDMPEERRLYSFSKVYFRPEAGGHHSRRSASHEPTSSMAAMRGDGASLGLGLDHEDNEGPHAQRSTHDLLIASRRGASVDLHNFHRDFFSHHADHHTPSPNYTPSTENISNESPTSSAASLSATRRDHGITAPGVNTGSIPPPESRGRASQALEDSRRALGSDLSLPSTRLAPPQVDTNSFVSSTLSPSSYSLSNETPSRSPSSRTPAESSDDVHHTSKNRNRFSLSAISGAFLDTVRLHHSSVIKERTEGTSIGLGVHEDSEKSGEMVRGRSLEKRRGSSTLAKVNGILGLEHEEGKESREGWREFKKGTYKYPISFSIPADSPPSLDCEFGSVVWTLTATVHRPGRFIPRMETVHTINVVATPSQDATEDVECITVNKSWEDQMEYFLSIVGRAFPIGSKIPVQLMILPIAKVKIHKVSVAVDENIRYHLHHPGVQKAAEHETRHVLFCLKCTNKRLTPILPLTEEHLRDSPLYVLIHDNILCTGQTEEARAYELTTQWMGPGPWPLQFNVEIPSTRDALRPTNMNKNGDILVSHVLRITVRVEKGGTGTGDKEDSGRTTLYDIIIQSPIHLLSHLCDQKYTSLPPYSPTLRPVPPPPDQSSSSRAGPSSIVLEVPVTEFGHTSECATPMNPAQRAAIKEGERLTNQFERLITGQETETGESPPSYNVATPSVPSVRIHHPDD